MSNKLKILIAFAFEPKLETHFKFQTKTFTYLSGIHANYLSVYIRRSTNYRASCSYLSKIMRSHRVLLLLKQRFDFLFLHFIWKHKKRITTAPYGNYVQAHVEWNINELRNCKQTGKQTVFYYY